MAPKLDKVTTFKIYIANLPAKMKNEDVSKLFEPFGRVVESEVFRGKNYAFVVRTSKLTWYCFKIVLDCRKNYESAFSTWKMKRLGGER